MNLWFSDSVSKAKRHERGELFLLVRSRCVAQTCVSSVPGFHVLLPVAVLLLRPRNSLHRGLPSPVVGTTAPSRLSRVINHRGYHEVSQWEPITVWHQCQRIFAICVKVCAMSMGLWLRLLLSQQQVFSRR